MKIPYGIASFEKLRREGFFFVDKTSYIQTIENALDQCLVVLRPRRFGKSLFVNMMAWYYDCNARDRYNDLFKGTWIHERPTPKQGSYMILSFDFSGINTQTLENANLGFLEVVRSRVDVFMYVYSRYFNEEERNHVFQQSTPNGIVSAWADLLEKKGLRHQVYVLIDEYDHFANNLLSQQKTLFQDLVKTDGYVRPFYEALKKAAGSVVDRIFITGVLPILLDSLTSGFNIAKNKSTSEAFAQIMGFSQQEIQPILQHLMLEHEEPALQDIKVYYDGYRFSESAEASLYNSDMVLYYASEYDPNQQEIKNIIDPNVITDYGKIRAILSIGSSELEREVLEQAVQEEGIAIREITQQFILTRESEFLFDSHTILSLLFYMGYLTILGRKEENVILGIPNLVMKKMYWEYLHVMQVLRSGMKVDRSTVDRMISDLLRSQVEPLIQMTEAFLKCLSNLDYRKFDEKYIKMTILSLVRDVELYIPHSEYPIGSEGYADLFFQAVYRPERFASYLVELKYLKTGQKAGIVNQTFKEAQGQMERYLKAAGPISPNLHGLVLVFQKDRCVRMKHYTP